MQAFSYKLYKGNLFKELVKTLLEDFGYITAPYGYENQFSTMIKKELNANHSDTAKRIRSSPDLLVYDKEKNEINLVEVKMSAKEYININKLTDYRKYWDDAIMVAVMNSDDMFYAEKIRDLREGRGFHTPKNDFKRINEYFPKIKSEEMEKYRVWARKLLEATSLKQEDEDETNDQKQEKPKLLE
jgi:hypothetical protein